MPRTRGVGWGGWGGMLTFMWTCRWWKYNPTAAAADDDDDDDDDDVVMMMMMIMMMMMMMWWCDDDDDDDDDPNETCQFRDKNSSRNWQVLPT